MLNKYFNYIAISLVIAFIISCIYAYGTWQYHKGILYQQKIQEQQIEELTKQQFKVYVKQIQQIDAYNDQINSLNNQLTINKGKLQDVINEESTLIAKNNHIEYRFIQLLNASTNKTAITNTSSVNNESSTTCRADTVLNALIEERINHQQCINQVLECQNYIRTIFESNI